MNLVFIGERVQRIRTRCLLGGVDGEVRNSSMSRAAIAYPRPLLECQHSQMKIRCHRGIGRGRMRKLFEGREHCLRCLGLELEGILPVYPGYQGK